MSDPIERLESFDPGDSMTPLPAADVRRRGDRLRRRNTALVAVGAAAAVALIATPLALIGTGGESRTVEPAPAPSISDSQEGEPSETAGPTFQGTGDVPADFPLDEGIVPDGDGEFSPPAADVEGVVFPESFCGTDVWPADGITGRLAVRSTGPEYAVVRELVSFETADEAVAVIAGLRASVQECPVGGTDDVGNPIAFSGYDLESGYDAATFSYTFTEALSGAAYQFVRVGRSVLATANGGEYSPQTARIGARELNDDNRALTGRMCVFADAGC